MNNQIITSQHGTVLVEKLLFSLTSKQLEQFRRPLESNVDTDIIQQFTTDTQEGRFINSNTLADVAGSVLRPSTNVRGNVAIANGWDSVRCRFSLTVMQGSQFEAASVAYVFHGYTDRYEPSYTGTLAPDTRLYFDKVTCYRRQARDVNGMPTIAWINGGSNQILRGYSEEEKQALGGIELVSVRPEDVYGYHMTSSFDRSCRAANGIGGNIVGVFNQDGNAISNIDSGCRFTRGSEVKFNRAKDISSSNYLSTLMFGMRQARSSTNADSYDATEMYGAARGAIRNTAVNTNGFLFELRNRTHFLQNGYVLLSELCACFPETSGNMVTPDTRYINPAMNAQDTSNWGRKDQVGVAAAMIAQVLPGIVQDCDLQQAAFTAHSCGNRQYTIVPNENYMRMMLDGMDMVAAFQKMADRLTTELLLPLTFGDRVGIDIGVAIDLTDSINIEISIDGSPMEPFLFPAFASALMSSVLDLDNDNLARLSNDVDHLMREGTGFDPVGTDAGNFGNFGNFSANAW